nr:hypothetical protein CFP56_36603 [Quercus suber]
MELMAKLALIKEETRRYEEVEKTNAILMIELATLSIDDTVLRTPRGNDIVSDETDDFVQIVEEEVKDPDAKVVVQPAPEGLVAIVVPFAADGPTTADDLISNAPLS